MSKVAYSEKVSAEFLEKAQSVCDSLGIKLSWLMVVMAIETCRTFKSSAINPYTKAIGLIQFMPATLKPWGLTTDQVAAMSEVDQLDLVRKYLAPYKGKIKSFTDTYLAVFYPVAIGKEDSYEFGATPAMKKKIADQNSAYDWNKDGVVQKWEVTKAIAKFIPKGFEDQF